MVNSTALCLTSLLSLNNDNINNDILITGMDIGDQLMSHETTRYTGIKLSICCIKSMFTNNDDDDDDDDLLFNELYEKSKIKSIIQQFSQFLKQNSLNVRFLSLNGLLLSFNKYDKLINQFQLSLSDVISLLKNLFDHHTSSSFSTESYTKLNNFLSVIIHLFSIKSSLYDNKDIKSLFDVFIIPLLESVTNSNAIHPSLFPLWIKLFASIGQKLNKLCIKNNSNYNELISYLNILHDKLIRSNMFLSTSEAKFQSCSCTASLINQFININNSELDSFLIKLTKDVEEKKNDDDDDGDSNMQPISYNNTLIISKEINRILISQLLSMQDNT